MTPSTLSRLVRGAGIAAVVSIATAAAAEITIYKQANFSGEALTLRNDSANLKDRGFMNQMLSVDVKSGQWQFCSQPDFKGDCVVLERGRYPTLGQNLNNRVESIREVTRTADRGRDRDDRYASRDDRYAGGDGRYSDRGRRGPAVELFGAPEFRGPSVTLDRDEDSIFDTGLGRRAASLVIHYGSWEVCSEPRYQGSCSVLEPGSYEALGRLTRRVGSIRRIG